ncbi:MAG: gamma-glutamylcyclotransferase family protein [Thermoplasmatota archaeon]
METVKVFVYGTLKIGGSLTNNTLEKRRLGVNEAILNSAVLCDLGPFPGVLLKDEAEEEEGLSKVYGELHVYSDPKAVLDTMDAIEGYNKNNVKDSLFIRRKVFVENIEKMQTEEAYMYEINNKYLPAKVSVLGSGKW